MKLKSFVLAVCSMVIICSCGNGKKTNQAMQENQPQAKSIVVPFIEELECIDDMIPGSPLLESFATDSVNVLNWPDAYGYAPECQFHIARGKDCLAVVFDVKGKDLRAKNLDDNGSSWEDSCCEFFISPDGKEYYNMEVTCIASVLMAKGEGRNNRARLDLEEVNKVQRWSTLPHEEMEVEGGDHEWSIGVLVPYSVIGLDGENLPETVGANFYKCGDLTATPHFVTWNPVGTPSPDFHRPEFFGTLILQ